METSFLIRPFSLGDTDAVINVWRRSGLVHPNNNPAKDIQRKLRVRPDLFLVGLLGADIVATVMIGYEGHRGWINYLGVLPEHQRRGYARWLMEEAERLLRLEGCSKINLQVRSTNASALSFYDRIGFARDEVISLGKRLEPDS
ncbi:MAG: GNAT family acetyltransferase [Opitutaceae bacterium]|nr:GNAT family acetyltransferase [Opitutaceae bacterium]